MDQMPLPFQREEEDLRTTFRELTGREVSLVITDNATSMLSVRQEGKSLSLRIHRMFLSADRNVLEEIASYAGNSRIRTPLIRAFINQNVHRLRESRRKKAAVRTAGKHRDLLEVFRSVNQEYFGGSVAASITWGSKSPRRSAARRTLGSYCGDSNVIRINPVLDSRSVPRFFLEFIVYHEMLHAHIGITARGTRRVVHSPEFKRRERMFRDYERAIAWEKKRWH